MFRVRGGHPTLPCTHHWFVFVHRRGGINVDRSLHGFLSGHQQLLVMSGIGGARFVVFDHSELDILGH